MHEMVGFPDVSLVQEMDISRKENCRKCNISENVNGNLKSLFENKKNEVGKAKADQ
jgi:hypothetical protein